MLTRKFTFKKILYQVKFHDFKIWPAGDYTFCKTLFDFFFPTVSMDFRSNYICCVSCGPWLGNPQQEVFEPPVTRMEAGKRPDGIKRQARSSWLSLAADMGLRDRGDATALQLFQEFSVERRLKGGDSPYIYSQGAPTALRRKWRVPCLCTWGLGPHSSPEVQKL